jgi:hypothetical protein
LCDGLGIEAFVAQRSHPLVNLREAHFVCKHKIVKSGVLATREIVELHLTFADEQGASVTIELDTSYCVGTDNPAGVQIVEDSHLKGWQKK